MPPFDGELPAVDEVGHAQFRFPYRRLTGGGRKTRLRGGCQIAGDLPAWAGIRTALSRNFKEIIPFPSQSRETTGGRGRNLQWFRGGIQAHLSKFGSYRCA